MAETKKPKAAARKASKRAPAKKAAAKAAPRKPAKKSAAKPKAAASRRPPPRGQATAIDGLSRLIDHPLVLDLLAVGAMAAVAAIAEHGIQRRSGGAQPAGSSKAVKAAGKAAAAAIGKRLMTEFSEVRKASKGAKGAKP